MDYSKDTLTRIKQDQLTCDETKKVTDFHEDRLMFIWINNQLHLCEPKSKLSHIEWAKAKFGVSHDQFEELPRGYCKNDRIQLFIGSNFEPLSEEHLKLFHRDFLKIALAQKKTFWSKGVIPVYNGVIVGKPGEVWPPLGTVEVYDASDIPIPKPLDDEIRQYDSMISRLQHEKQKLIESACYCDKCKAYYPKEDERVIFRTETAMECVYQDCGYGDDDEYAEVTRSVTYRVCPLCGELSYKSSIVVGTGPSNKRWE